MAGRRPTHGHRTAMSAVQSRSRRSTAGRRMSALVGEALEADETFWGHETWSEEPTKFARGSDSESDDGDGNGSDGSSVVSDGSYKLSDEDPENRVDKFDSDFDDSESEDEGDKEGEEEEEEIRAEERREARKKKGSYREPPTKKGGAAGAASAVSAGRELMNKKKSSAARRRDGRAVGEGLNAGLVLNFPGHASTAAIVTKAAPAARKPTPPRAPTTTLAGKRSRRTPRPNLHRPSGRTLRAGTISKTIAATQSAAVEDRESHKRQLEVQRRLKSNPNRRKYTQEELLIEAATVTEGENERWILGRQRVREADDRLNELKKLAGMSGKGGKVVRKFHSRRGCYNTLTFPEMDSVPEILTWGRGGGGGGGGGAAAAAGDATTVRKCRTREEAERAKERAKASRACVVTGKKARYRDPKTMLGYHDLDAFRELRRRLEAGEPLDQRKADIKREKEKEKPKAKSPPPDLVADANGKAGRGAKPMVSAVKREEPRSSEKGSAKRQAKREDAAKGSAGAKRRRGGGKEKTKSSDGAAKPEVVAEGGGDARKKKFPKIEPPPPPPPVVVVVVGGGSTIATGGETNVVVVDPTRKRSSPAPPPPASVGTPRMPPTVVGAMAAPVVPPTSTTPPPPNAAGAMTMADHPRTAASSSFAIPIPPPAVAFPPPRPPTRHEIARAVALGLPVPTTSSSASPSPPPPPSTSKRGLSIRATPVSPPVPTSTDKKALSPMTMVNDALAAYAVMQQMEKKKNG